MEKYKRTRQSNREYQERIRRERNQQKETARKHLRVLPQSGGKSRSVQFRQMDEAGRSSSQMNKSQKNNNKKRQAAQNPRRQRTNARRQNTAGVRRTNAGTQEIAGKRRANARRQNTAGVQRANAKKQISSERTRQEQNTVHKKQVYFDYTLVFIVIFLILFGLLMLYTASIYTDSFFRRQCMFALLGLAVMFFLSFLNYHIYENKYIQIMMMVVSIALVFMVRIPSLGQERNGASRWLKIGSLTFQPVEIFKIAVILLNAALITHFSKIISKARVLIMFAVFAGIEMLFVLVVTDNLSSALIIGAITVLMVFVAHPGYKLFVGSGIGIAAAVSAYLYYVINFCEPVGKNFRYTRIFAWLAPDRLPDQSKVYQTTQALYSIGSGGLWGKGLGTGTQKMILPEAMNDMIFAIICEELGMIGAFLVLVMFAILLYRLMFIAKNSKDLFGGMIVTGIFAHFMIQVIFNVGVVTNLLPSTGVTLPFISYGGTALLLLMAEIGIALNVSRQIDFEQPRLVRKRVRKS